MPFFRFGFSIVKTSSYKRFVRIIVFKPDQYFVLFFGDKVESVIFTCKGRFYSDPGRKFPGLFASETVHVPDPFCLDRYCP